MREVNGIDIPLCPFTLKLRSTLPCNILTYTNTSTTTQSASPLNTPHAYTRTRNETTHRPRNPRIPIQPPSRLQPHRLPKHLPHLLTILNRRHDPLHNRRRQPLLVRHIREEHRPDGDAGRTKQEQGRPYSLFMQPSKQSVHGSVWNREEMRTRYGGKSRCGGRW